MSTKLLRSAPSATAVCLLAGALCMPLTVPAGDPFGATYCPENDRVFWYVHITDTHIGASGSQDHANLEWMVTEAKDVVNPSFIVLSGDITDSTNGGIWPGGPYAAEWIEYQQILGVYDHDGDPGTPPPDPKVSAADFYDIPGNHDSYNDRYFEFYVNNSVQGMATGSPQVSWTREFPFGKYHFLGANTAGNDGRSFSIFFPYGDYAGIDTSELAFIQSELIEHADADLTIAFGHHAFDQTADISGDTWLFYGAPEFADLLQSFGASGYGYGHTHAFSEGLFTGGNDYQSGASYSMAPGMLYLNVNSLGKASNNHFNVVAIDCNGLSTVTQPVRTWPVVLITAPVDRDLGVVDNPLYGAYEVPNAADNPIRALVFDPTELPYDENTKPVEYRINAGAWQPMVPVDDSGVGVNPRIWEASWDASGSAEGEHTIEVRATTADQRSRADQIRVYVTANTPPQDVDQFATGEIAGAGTVSGIYLDTHALDEQSESITEQSSGGKPKNRYSYLEHTWMFQVQPGASVVLHATVSATQSLDGDAFEFAYSIDNLNFEPMFSVQGTGSPQDFAYPLPSSLSGTVYVRVRDTDRTAGNNSAFDTVSADVIFIRTQIQTSGTPPTAPSNLSAGAVSSSQINLGWTDNADDELGFYIERLSGTEWSRIANLGANTTAFQDTGLPASTTFAYRVLAYNAAGESGTSNEAVATTLAPPPISLSVTAYKVKAVGYVDLTWSGASGPSMDIQRDGGTVATVANTGTYTDTLGKRPNPSYVYRVCDAGTTTCSNDAVVGF